MNSISNSNNNYSSHIDKVGRIHNRDLMLWSDVFDIETLEKLFDKKGKPGIFVSDHCTYCDNFVEGVEFLGLPFLIEQQRQMWSLDDFVDEKTSTKYCFNFMINKKHLHRYLCMKLVELFGLKYFTYTWSGIGKEADCSLLIKQHHVLGKSSPLTEEQFAKILSPVEFDPHFFMHHGVIPEVDSNVVNYGGNRSSWDLGCKHLFCDSAVSLITESIGALDPTQKSSVFTEKTIYSVLGLGFPIWVGGGYKQAEQWKSLGFDIFDDVINHDYQYYDTLLERCVYAFILNNKILTDINHARLVRSQCLSRLKNNRQLLLTGQLSSVIQNKINKLDGHYQQILKLFVKI